MTRIYATIVGKHGVRAEQGDLVCVELPPNCTLDGEPSEMRAAILFLMDRASGNLVSDEEHERFEEIAKRYR